MTDAFHEATGAVSSGWGCTLRGLIVLTTFLTTFVVLVSRVLS